MAELAYLNGEFLEIDSARVSIEDRGYQFGDAVYEFITSYNGRMFCMKAHLDRLERSMQGLAFPPVPRQEIEEAVRALFDRAGISRAGIYLQVSRGVAPRSHAFPEGIRPQVVMTIRAMEDKPPEVRQKGVSAITVEDIRWGRCDLKTVQLVPNAMAKQQALREGADDAVFVSADRIVREATSSNIALVKNGVVVTHPLTPAILPGITRETVIDLCRKMDIPVEERFFRVQEMLESDELFLTGTVSEVQPVVRVDNQPVGSGKAGPVTKSLYAALRELAGS